MHKPREFSHAMLREIFEQPEAIARTLAAYVEGSSLREEVFLDALQALAGRESMLIAASGSSRHAGLIAEILLEDFAGISVDVEYSSEYIYRSTQTLRNPCFLAISQSGETADTTEALREAIARGCSTIAITNHAESSMAQMAACYLPTAAGPERAVPATKSFTTQVLVLTLLALYAGRVRGQMTRAVVESRLKELHTISSSMEMALPRWESQIANISRTFNSAQSFLFLGRGIHYPIALEGALKMKESAYIQAQGYPSGELKHGPNALVDRGTPLVILGTRDSHSPDSLVRYEKTLNLLRDLERQQPVVISVITEGDTEIASLSRHVIEVPRAPEFVAPIYEVVPLQLLAYEMSIARGIDVDQPRNLVKAVVQE